AYGGVGATAGGGAYPVGDPGFTPPGRGTGAIQDPGFSPGTRGPTGAEIDPGFRPPQPTGEQTGLAGLENAAERNLGSINEVMNQMKNIEPSSPDGQKQMMKLQQKMQQLQMFQQAVTDMIKKQDDIMSSMIQTLGR